MSGCEEGMGKASQSGRWQGQAVVMIAQRISNAGSRHWVVSKQRNYGLIGKALQHLDYSRIKWKRFLSYVGIPGCAPTSDAEFLWQWKDQSHLKHYFWEHDCPHSLASQSSWTTSLAWTSMVMSAPRVFLSWELSLPRTRSVRSSRSFEHLVRYSGTWPPVDG